MKLALLALAAGWVALPHAYAQSGTTQREGPNLTCASDDGRKHFCQANTAQGVELVNQRSGSACRRGVDWGWDDRSVWVDHGCRADFFVRAEARRGPGPGPGPDRRDGDRGYGDRGYGGDRGYDRDRDGGGWNNGWGDGNGWITNGSFNFEGGRPGSGSFRDRDGRMHQLGAARVHIGNAGDVVVAFQTERGRLELGGQVERRQGRRVFARVRGDGIGGGMEIEMGARDNVRRIAMRDGGLEWNN